MKNLQGNVKKEIKLIREEIHKVIDPYWKSGLMDRKLIYAKISSEIGYEFHCSSIKSVEEGNKAYVIASLVVNGKL